MVAWLIPPIRSVSYTHLARDLIKAAGHGDHFGHGTGHSLGLEIHEEPRFSILSEKTIIPAGAVMTVEPGIYVPGFGGVDVYKRQSLRRPGVEY